MRQVLILEDNDTVEPTDWCRPLTLTTMSGGHSVALSFENMFSGTPQNNTKWVQVQDVFGPNWFYKTAQELNNYGGSAHEFVRGDVPAAHQLDMKGYNSFRDLRD